MATEAVRIVRVCPACIKEGVPPYRRFFFTEGEAEAWRCPDHGRSEVQVNKPYVRPVV